MEEDSFLVSQKLQGTIMDISKTLRRDVLLIAHYHLHYMLFSVNLGQCTSFQYTAYINTKGHIRCIEIHVALHTI